MLAIFLLTLIAAGAAHKLGWGKCPDVEEIEGFDMERFQGDWFVMSKLNADIKCVTNHYSALPSAGLYNYTEKQQYGRQILIKEVELETDENGNLEMNYQWPIADSSFVVLDTDYLNYASIFKCQMFPGFHRWSAAILSRDVNMDDSTINDHLNVLKDYVDTTEMDYIDHSDCATLDDAMFTVRVGPGLSVKPGGQGIRSFIDGIRSFSEPLRMKEDEESAEPDPLTTKEMHDRLKMDIEFF